MFRRISALATSLVMVLAGLVSVSAPAQAAQDFYAPNSVYENRDITPGVAFTPDAEDFSVDVNGSISFSSSQYQALGSGKVLKVTAVIKKGTDVVAQEVSVNFSGAVNSSYGSNSIVTDGSASSLTAIFYLGSRIIPGSTYQVDYVVTADSTVLAAGTDFSLNSLTGNFYRLERSTAVAGAENFVRAEGTVCLSESAYSSLSAGDVLEFSVSDASSNNYSTTVEWNDSNYNSDFNTNHTLSSLDLSDKLQVRYSLTGTVSAATTFAPEISIKKQGTSTELAALCSQTPTSAPTLTASATGIEFSQSLPAGVSQMLCNLADARYPLVAVSTQTGYAYSGDAKCNFFGIKQGDYVGWISYGTYVFSNNRGMVYSFKSPTSTSVTYAGGNGTFKEYTGTAGGNGQGSLALSDITYNGFDFATSSNSSDGQGGLLVASLEGADNTLSLRRLTPSGMDASFGGSGTATLDLQPFNFRSRGGGYYQLGWYGTSKDKFVVSVETSSYGGPGYQGAYNANQDLQVILGDYASGQTASYAISRADSGSYCKSVITGTGNNSYRGSISGILSGPSTTPLFLMSCYVERNENNNYYSSNINSVATLDGNGKLVLKYKLGAEPTAAEPCAASSVSLANSAATGSQPLVASYQVTWLPTSGGCMYGGNQGMTSADVVSRDLYVINADTATTTVTPITDVLTVTGTQEPTVCGYGGYCLGGTTLILSGPNVFILAGTATGGQQATTLSYRVGVLSNSSFGTLEQLPNLTVNGTTAFGDGTRFSQIRDYSENDATSVLLLRSDFSTGTTASRVSMSDGATTSYQQIAQSGSMMGMFDGFSTAVGNSGGDLNFFGIESRTSAVLGQWVTSGAFDPALSALPINQGAANTGVANPNQMGPNPPQNQNVTPTTPYTGPVVKTPGLEKSYGSGQKLKLTGERLSSVSKVEINGKTAELKVNSAGEIEIVIPRDLGPGTYDMVVTSSSGKLTIQDAIKIGAASVSEGLTRPSAKKNDAAKQVKVRVFELIGAGKVQIFVNGKEIAWVNAKDASDSKLFDGYLVRTVKLAAGKNVIEVYVNGVRTQRWAYSG